YTLASLLCTAASNGQSGGIWTAVEPGQDHVGTSSFSLEESLLEALLVQTGTETATGVRINVPNPDGKLRSFIVWENTLLPVALKEKFPQIRTYSGVLSDNPRVSLKLEKTTSGWYGMVFEERNTYYFYPDQTTDPIHYLVAE